MKYHVALVVSLWGVLAFAEDRKQNAGPTTEDLVSGQIARYTRDKWLVILDAEHDFYSAKREAERISKLSRLPFSMQGMEFHRRRGLTLPDKGDGGLDAGGYIARRYDGDAENPHGYISIERSNGYPGLREGFYVVVGAICSSSRAPNAKLCRFQPFAPSAYIAKTQIYMGCIH
jgi:hypothetical protein